MKQTLHVESNISTGIKLYIVMKNVLRLAKPIPVIAESHIDSLINARQQRNGKCNGAVEKDNVLEIREQH